MMANSLTRHFCPKIGGEVVLHYQDSDDERPISGSYSVDGFEFQLEQGEMDDYHKGIMNAENPAPSPVAGGKIYRCIEQPFGKTNLEGFDQGQCYCVVQRAIDVFDLYGMPPEFFHGEYMDTTNKRNLKRFFKEVIQDLP